MTINSVLYVPTGFDLWQTLSRLGSYAEAHGWPVGAYTRDWTEVVQLLGGDYQIAVVPTMAALDPRRLPRVVAADQDSGSVTSSQQRPRWARR